MAGLDVDSVQMREVSPMGGLCSQQERSEALAGMAARCGGTSNMRS
jgi:hypothetical protein